MDSIALRSATDLAAAIRRGEIGSRELLDCYLDRIARLNPALNAVVTLDVERARRAADAADAARARGDALGPLHGLPVTIKDSHETEGLRTTSGFPAYGDHVPTRDADAVARLKAAGAIVFGKTNLSLLAGDVQSYNPIFGVSNNPWNAERTCGGSSGGAAAAVATGLTAFELGSDIGGSIRTPANWNGIYGHKPSHGLVPTRGHIPGPPGTLQQVDLNVTGPLARSADDLGLLLDVLAGPTPDRAVAWTLNLPPPRRQRLRDYRIAAWFDDEAYPIDAGVRAPLDAAVDALRRSGCQVDDARPAVDLRALVRTYFQLLLPIIMGDIPEDEFARLAAAGDVLGGAEDSHLVWGALFGTERHRDWLHANEARERIRVVLAEFFTRYDALLLPETIVAAIPHDHSEPIPARFVTVNGAPRPYLDMLAWIAPASLAWLPASVAPVGRTPDGLPVGVQIVGPYLEDRTPIDVARQLAGVIGGYETPPIALSGS